MSTPPNSSQGQLGTKHIRWLLGFEPIFEGGWLHRGKRAHAWDVESKLIALAVLGDVTVDLSQAKSVPYDIAINAYAGLRDVEVLVGTNTHVEISGRANNGRLRNDVPDVPENRREHVVHVHGHTALGDVTVRVADKMH